MKINISTPELTAPLSINAEFRHFRRYDDKNHICQNGGHTSMSFVWNTRLVTIVTRCSLRDKFSKVAARLICIQKALRLIFKDPMWIGAYTSRKEEMDIDVSPKEHERYWWVAKPLHVE